MKSRIHRKPHMQEYIQSSGMWRVIIRRNVSVKQNKIRTGGGVKSLQDLQDMACNVCLLRAL
jgi:hypothetical protein